MGRAAKEPVQKLKEEIIKLPHEDAEVLYEWLDMLVDVRVADKAADAAKAARQAATAQPTQKTGDAA